MQSTNWSPEHSRALREYLARRMSYSEISDAINARFKTAYSRSAVIGRAKRMQHAGSDRPEDRPKLPPNAAAPRLHNLRERYFAEFCRMPVFERKELPRLRCADVDPRRLSLAELESGDCRYPYGGDEEGDTVTFCGHSRREGSSYCAAHFQLTRGPGTASERAADKFSPEIAAAGWAFGPNG